MGSLIAVQTNKKKGGTLTRISTGEKITYNPDPERSKPVVTLPMVEKEERTFPLAEKTKTQLSFGVNPLAERMVQDTAQTQTGGKFDKGGAGRISGLPTLGDENNNSSNWLTKATDALSGADQKLGELLTTPAKSGFFEGVSALGDGTLKGFGRDFAYGSERAGAALLGVGENITDFIGSTFYQGLSALTQKNNSLRDLVMGEAPEDTAVSRWAQQQADAFLENSKTRDYEQSIRERYNPSQGAENLTGVGQTVVQMLPAIATGNIAAKAIGSGVNAINAPLAADIGSKVSQAVFGLQSAGAGANEAKQEGASTTQALAYGAASGLLETSIENIAGGIPGMGQGKIREIAEALKASPIVEKALDIAGEGGEGALSTIISPYLKRAIYDPDAANATGEEIAESAIMEAVAAGVLQAGIELPAEVSNMKSQVERARAQIGSNADIMDRVNQRLNTPGQVQSDFVTLPTAGKQYNNVTLLPGAQVQQQVQTMPGSGIGTDAQNKTASMAAPEDGTAYGDQGGSVGAAAKGFDPWSAFQGTKSEFFPEGANAARPVDVPTTDADGNPIRKTASTAMGAKAIPDDVVGDIQNMVMSGQLSYSKVKDRESIDRAQKTITDKGYDRALEHFSSEVKSGVVSKDMATLGQQLLINAANAGDGKATAELLSLYAQMETTAGQAVQAASILRKLDPSYQLYAIQKTVQTLNESLPRKKRRQSNSGNIYVDSWMEQAGKLLAERVKTAAEESTKNTKTVVNTIISDLVNISSKKLTSETKKVDARTANDRMIDLYNNRDKYQEAWSSAKQTLLKKYGKDEKLLNAVSAWLESDIDSIAFSEIVNKGRAENDRLEIKVDQSLVEEFMQQTDQDGRDAVMEKIYQNVADQVPSTWKEKWNALRYLAMLANPRTHVRNMGGNVAMQPVRIAKDRVAAAIEGAVSKATGGQIERTKSFVYNPNLYRAAWSDWANVKDSLTGSKYDDVKSEIESRKKVFKLPVLEKARTGNAWLLEMEDALFKRVTYADALAGYLNANGVNAEALKSGQVDPALMSRARDYAGREAMRATFNDRNAFSDKVVQIAKELGPAGEAVLPFKRTPANVLLRGVEYSPVGLVKSLTYDLYKVKQGEKTAAQAIDGIAAGLTGSGLMALGAWLFAKGIVTSGGGDDEKQDAINDLTGGQNYALNLPGGGSVTLDWLAPSALPFFMGVELADSMGQGGSTAEAIMEALKSVSDPMLELSMLQSLNDMIDSVSYSENKLGALAQSAVISYFTQAVPTVLGQAERTGEDKRMTTYTDKNKTLPTDIQYALGKISARLPGWDYQQIPYIDAWGREEKTGTLPIRATNNFLNPAYTSSMNVTPVDAEIQRVYSATGEGIVVPSRASKDITIDGEKKYLTADEYVKYATHLGQEKFKLLEQAVGSKDYKGLSDAQKVEFIGDVYAYARSATEKEQFGKEMSDWMEEAKANDNVLGAIRDRVLYGGETNNQAIIAKTKTAVEDIGLTVEQYQAMRSGMDADGNDSVSQKEAKAYLDSQNFTREQKAQLWTLINSKWKNNPYD